MAAAQPSSLDGFVLAHLQSRGFTDAAESLKKELEQRSAAGGAAADLSTASVTRPALVRMLVSSMQIRLAYDSLREWVDASLDAFKPELRAVLFPFLVHCYLELVQGGEAEEAAAMLHECGEKRALAHDLPEEFVYTPERYLRFEEGGDG